MVRALLVDDDELSRLNIRLIAEQISELELSCEFDNALEAYRYLLENPVDLLFLDIEMPQFSGMDLVRSVGLLPHIVFISGKKDYAAGAFDYLDKVIDYIVKPVCLERLRTAIDRYHKALRQPRYENEDSTDNFIFVRADKKYIKIGLDELLYIETLGDYTLFRTAAQKHVVNTSLKQICEQFKHPNFIKVHRSFIVNVSKIEDIENNSLVIAGKVIPISRAHRNKLMKRLPIL